MFETLYQIFLVLHSRWHKSQYLEYTYSSSSWCVHDNHGIDSGDRDWQNKTSLSGNDRCVLIIGRACVPQEIDHQMHDKNKRLLDIYFCHLQMWRSWQFPAFRNAFPPLSGLAPFWRDIALPLIGWGEDDSIAPWRVRAGYIRNG